MSAGRYDLIVIGSGVGALSTASLMARLHEKRVLVIERHHGLGGFSQAFRRRGGYRWDVGLHYVGQMSPSSLERQVMDFITGGRLGWTRMSEPFERIVYPGFSFDVHGSPDRYERDLVARFPHEKRALRRYFVDIRRVARWAVWNSIGRSASRLTRGCVAAATKPWHQRALQTTAEYMCRTFGDPKLRALLTSRWGLCGLLPSKSAFCEHAVIVMHYLHGGYYPKGGAARIAETIVPIVEARGGAFVTGQEVTRIEVEGGRATAVEAVDRRGGRHRYQAAAIVSNAGAFNTFAKLLPKQVGAERAMRLRPLVEQAASAVVVYVGLRGDPRDLGLRGENVWLNDSFDHDANAEPDRLMAGRPGQCFLSCASLRDVGQMRHTAQIMSFIGRHGFALWGGTGWQRRGSDYRAVKERMADGLVALAERHYPGFAAQIDFLEVSTPLSVEHFTASPYGAIYGLPGTPERFEKAAAGARTHVRNLYLTGADGFVHGIWGAVVGGVAAAGALTGGLGFLRVMAAIKNAHTEDCGRVPGDTASVLDD